MLGVVIMGDFSGLKLIGTWVCVSDRKVWFLTRVRVRSSRGLCSDLVSVRIGVKLRRFVGCDTCS